MLTTSYTYDNLGRLARISHENSLSQILERFDYTYDVDRIDGTGNPVYKGLRTKRMMTSNFISGTTQHYAYNGQGWLTRWGSVIVAGQNEIIHELAHTCYIGRDGDPGKPGKHEYNSFGTWTHLNPPYYPDKDPFDCGVPMYP